MQNAATFDGALIVMGDFNIDPVRDQLTKQGKLLKDWSLENCLTQIVKKSTRRRIVQRSSGTTLEESMIDLVYTNRTHQVDCLNFPYINSDHDFLWCKVSAFGAKRVTKKFIIRDYTGLTQHSVKNHIKGVPNGLQEIEDQLHHILEKLAPERVVRTRDPQQLLNPRIEKLKKRRDRLLKKFKKTGNSKHLEKCKQLSKQLKKTIAKETRNTFQIKAKTPNPKCFWNAVNQLEGKNAKQELRLKINNSICEDDNIMANHVANYFDSKIKNLTAGLSKIEIPNVDQLDVMEDLTVDEIKNALKKMKGKMSAGVDGIPLKLVKLFGQACPQAFADLFNSILKSGFIWCSIDFIRGTADYYCPD